MPDIEPLLNPISEAKPSGEDLKYTPLFDKIRSLRKLADTGPMGSWETDTQEADFGLISKLASDAIATKSKDLQLSSWLTEAWIYEHSIGGLISGLDLSRELIVRFWDSVYPELDEGDAEPRATSLEWVGSYFDPAKGSSPILALRSVPLTQSGHSWMDYQDSRRIGYEAEVAGNQTKKEARAAAVAANKITPETFDKDFEATKKVFYKTLETDLKAALISISNLDEVCREKFEDVAPSLTPLKKAIEEVSNVCHILLLKKLQKEPDVAEPQPSKLTASPDTLTEEISVPDSQLDRAELGTEIKSEAQAMLHVVAAAQFIRRQNPAHPAAYLLLRALRWGELRSVPDLQTAELPAPQPEVRKTLRVASVAGNWQVVLDSAENAMGSACGRGWLDLQRYSFRACTELGYPAAAQAIRSELKTMLADFPNMIKATLNDDTGAANPETLEWLRKEGLIG